MMCFFILVKNIPAGGFNIYRRSLRREYLQKEQFITGPENRR